VSSDGFVHSSIILGVFFLTLGIAFLVIPLLSRAIPPDTRIPNLFVYIYHKDNFYFVTSPLMILISFLSLLIFILRSAGRA